MPQHTAPRQPLSCENCRKRKIKCQSGQVPCATCIKRGYAQTCYYKRNADGLRHVQSNESELLQRVRNLEDLLKQQIAQTSLSPPEHRPGSPSTRSSESSPWPGSQMQSVTTRSRQNGKIMTSPAGYQHFVPNRSTLEANLVYELVESVPSPLCSTNFPVASDTTSSRSTLLDMLPPLRQCDELKAVFFEVFSPLFHVLHDPTFDAVYEKFRMNVSEPPLSWLGLLFIVLGIAITALDDDHPLLRDLGREASAAANIKKLSAKYRSGAMQCLTADQFMYQHNLQTLQTLILLAYAMNHANISSWALLGLTSNIAVKIGCHIDPSLLGLGVVESEERRRCWAALMVLYTVQNTCLGNTAPQLMPADVDLPADIDDDRLENDLLIGSRNGGNTYVPSKMSYILLKFRLYKIAAEICEHAQDERLADHRVVLALDQKLSDEEREHASRFSGQELPMYHIVHHYILQSYTHHLYLILHRDLLHVHGAGDDMVAQSRERCKSSAMTILEIHGRLYETPQFKPYRWYVYGLGSFQAFLAVSVLIMVSSTTKTRNEDSERSCALVEQCVQRFEAMAGRSDICSRAAAIVRRILRNGGQGGGAQPFIENNNSRFLDGEGLQQYSLNPASRFEYVPAPTSDWTSNPELEALVFDIAPQQWMAPSAFMWDRWGNINVA